MNTVRQRIGCILLLLCMLLSSTLVQYKDNADKVDDTEAIIEDITILEQPQQPQISDTRGIVEINDTGAGSPYAGGTQYPNSIHYNGTTYISWQAGSSFDPHIRAYNHQTEEWSDTVVIGTNPLSADSHGPPVLAIDAGGYLHVIYGSHNSDMYHAKSNYSENITEWTNMSSAGIGTYPNLIVDGNRMYLFFRFGTTGNGRWSYKYSGNNGTSWSGRFQIINFYDDFNTGVYTANWVMDRDRQIIHATWIQQKPGDTSTYQNQYHTYLNLTDWKMYSMNGTDLGTEINKSEGETYCKVSHEEDYNSTHAYLHLDSNGYPYLIWRQYHAGGGCNGNFTYWNGTGWEPRETIVSVSSHMFGGDFIIHSNTSIEAYFKVEYNIERWSWDGTTWAKVATLLVTSATPRSNTLSVPEIVFNYSAPLKFMVGQYAGSVFEYDASIYAYFPFLWDSVVDFNMGTASYNDSNYQIETNKWNPQIPEGQIELGSIKGDSYLIDCINSSWKETAGYGIPFGAGSVGGSTDKNITTEGRRRINISSGGIGRKYGVVSDFGYSGDFDFEEQVNIITLLATNYCSGGIGCREDVDNTVLIYRSRGAAPANAIGTYCMLGSVHQGGFSFNTTDTEVWFRITRASSTIKSYYKLNLGDTWTELGSWDDVWTGVGSPIKWASNGGGGSEPTVVMEYSNWKLNSGTVSAGGYKSGGNLTTNAETIPTGKRIWSFTIDYLNVSSTYTLTPKILRASNDSVMWTGSAITSGSSKSYNIDDFGTINESFKIQIVFAGDGGGTPALTRIYGDFAGLREYDITVMKDKNNNTISTFLFPDSESGDTNVRSDSYYYCANATAYWWNFTNFVNDTDTLNVTTNIKASLFGNLSNAENFTDVVTFGTSDTYGNCSVTGLQLNQTYFMRAEILQIPGTQSSGSYNSTITKINGTGNSIINITFIPRSFSLTLYPGWNLISAPFVINQTINWLLAKDNITVVTARINSSYYTYTVTSGSNATLQAGKGYYVYTNALKVITLTETWRKSVTVNLTKGFNLVGISIEKNGVWNSQTFMTYVGAKTVTRRSSTGIYSTVLAGNNQFSVETGAGYYIYAITTKTVIL